ncbi:MAG TPA: hypothetical protein VE544_09230 [Nitrososphaeraceae archaeon]|nr:hypothetical protein [Nitrososphaeraceae archaeon]
METLTSGFEVEARSGDIPVDYNPPGMRCCAGSRVHRKTIPLPGLSNAGSGVPLPPPSNPARRRSRKGNRRLPCPLPYHSSGILTLWIFRV